MVASVYDGVTCAETELVEACEQPVRGRRLCAAHLSYRSRHGLPVPPARSKKPCWSPVVGQTYGWLLCLAVTNENGESYRAEQSPSDRERDVPGRYAALVRCIACGGPEYLITFANLKRGTQCCCSCQSKAAAQMQTSAQRRAAARAGQIDVTSEQWREIAVALNAAQTPEVRSVASVKGNVRQREYRQRCVGNDFEDALEAFAEVLQGREVDKQD